MQGQLSGGVQVNDPEDGVIWELGRRQGTVEWWVRGCWAYGAQDHRTHKMQLVPVDGQVTVTGSFAAG